MIAVSNTTPLRYLIAIKHEHLLGKIFEKVFVPSAVYEELTDVGTPESVRRRVSSLPAWFEVCATRETSPALFPTNLHRGERDAILLAEEIRPDILLIDDQIGPNIALARNLPLSGTLGVVERADMAGLIRNFPDTLKQLRGSGFFIGEQLEQLLVDRHAARRRAP